MSNLDTPNRKFLTNPRTNFSTKTFWYDKRKQTSKKMMFQSKINLQRNNTGVIKNMYIGKYYDESMEKNSVEK